MLLAVTLFGEHLSRREAIASFVIVAAAALLSYRPGDISVPWLGVAAIAGACLSWALDNNLSQRLSEKLEQEMLPLLGQSEDLLKTFELKKLDEAIKNLILFKIT